MLPLVLSDFAPLCMLQNYVHLSSNFCRTVNIPGFCAWKYATMHPNKSFPSKLFITIVQSPSKLVIHVAEMVSLIKLKVNQ